ncbi:MAG: NTP transferase domain-containing protein [Gemmataceae bacterium]
MQIVIPMSGRGSRYAAAGYANIKPLIEVDGRPIIEHIVRLFPGERDFVFICARDHLETTPLRDTLERLAPGGKILGIEPHKKGPVWAALMAEQAIADDKPTLLHYCDFSVHWDYERFKRTMYNHDPAGCVQAYRGFHPHTLGPNLYAYMRVENGRMLEIQEKHCFTDDRMNEYSSSGAYYFRSGRLMKQLFHRAVERNLSTNGEFYASMPYNLLVTDGEPVMVYELDHFLQWGTPEDLDEYRGWSDYFRRASRWRPTRPADDTQVLLPMVGAGVRFQKEGYTQPKPLVRVAGVPMVRRSLDSLPPAKSWLAVCRTDHLEHPGLVGALNGTDRDVQALAVEGMTAGQASTCLIGCERLDPEKPLSIAPCDAAVVYNEAKFAALKDDPTIDCIVWTFRNHPHANRNPKQYGWVKADADGWIEGVSCKKPLGPDVKRDPGIIGLFWFRKAKFFIEAAEELIRQNRRVNGEFYADSAVEVLLEQGRRAKLFDVRHLICFGVPADVKTYEYWEAYFRKAAHHPYGKRPAAGSRRFAEASLARRTPLRSGANREGVLS